MGTLFVRTKHSSETNHNNGSSSGHISPIVGNTAICTRHHTGDPPEMTDAENGTELVGFGRPFDSGRQKTKARRDCAIFVAPRPMRKAAPVASKAETRLLERLSERNKCDRSSSPSWMSATRESALCRWTGFAPGH
ncbi:hypothetical protein ZHAS_00020274 [Anopheles sinensis]|uniref:Uncharacterized protein n=1 Tax=Anopheles sinensis TaxID=74873 RepID=A0A084WPC5_ANOSI|nr:hypothetical protein ZHAS_00020274 [Anopheles sinensis]